MPGIPIKQGIVLLLDVVRKNSGIEAMGVLCEAFPSLLVETSTCCRPAVAGLNSEHQHSLRQPDAAPKVCKARV